MYISNNSYLSEQRTFRSIRLIDFFDATLYQTDRQGILSLKWSLRIMRRAMLYLFVWNHFWLRLILFIGRKVRFRSVQSYKSCLLHSEEHHRVFFFHNSLLISFQLSSTPKLWWHIFRSRKFHHNQSWICYLWLPTELILCNYLSFQPANLCLCRDDFFY